MWQVQALEEKMRPVWTRWEKLWYFVLEIEKSDKSVNSSEFWSQNTFVLLEIGHFWLKGLRSPRHFAWMAGMEPSWRVLSRMQQGKPHKRMARFLMTVAKHPSSFEKYIEELRKANDDFLEAQVQQEKGRKLGPESLNPSRKCSFLGTSKYQSCIVSL